jgi:mannose-1-phosphate guanylyltransferase
MHLPYAIILSGGQGTRLWPLTANGIPKAFLSFDSTGISLLKNTILRVSNLLPYERIIIVAGQSHKKELHIHSKDIPDENIILEPTGRGTLSCIGLTSLYVKRKDPSSVMIVMPGEQLIKDDKAFQQVITEAVKSAQKYNCVVTLGIKPNFPATRFGYIHVGEKVSSKGDISVFKSMGFTEKPDEKKALEFTSSGKYFWNSGIYVFPTLLLLNMISEFAPDVYNNLSEIEKFIGTPDEKKAIDRIYPDMRNISIDYAVMEKSSNMLVIPADMGWNDMGTWTEVAETWEGDEKSNLAPLESTFSVGAVEVLDTWESDEKANACFGKYITIDSSGCIIYSPEKLVATIGIHDVIIVDTPNGILICAKDRADDVKLLVKNINQ